MAQRTLVMLEDDLEGGEASETVMFALDGAEYEIDLNDEHAAQLRDVFAPYLGAARRSGSRSPAPKQRRSSAKSAATSGDKVDPKAVRAWATANGVEVSQRGRISGSVVAQFREAGQ